MRCSFVIALVLAIGCLVSDPAAADKRVALVVGNATYRHAGVLANPSNDAADMSAVFARLGFQVLNGLDLDKAQFERMIREFAASLEGADVGVFFYAGHGLQVAGQNYLIPVDAELTTISALDFELIRLELVHRTMERAALTNVIFLDACRNNPFERSLRRAMGSRSAEIGRGLAAVESGAGTLISFSTQPGNVAADGTGRNSPFAGALVKQLAGSSDDLSAILIAVRNDVMRETQRQQVPWEHSALTGRLYFGTPPKPSGPAPASQITEAERAWTLVKDSNEKPILESYIKQFGDSVYGAIARARLAGLEQRAAEAGPSVASGVEQFDGRWILRGTSNGKCFNASPVFAAEIERGVVTVSIDGIKHGGTVKADGTLRFAIKSQDGRPAVFIGALAGSSGSGRYGVQGATCAGTFKLSRD